MNGCPRRKTSVTTAFEVNLEGLLGEISKLVVVLTNGVIIVYDQKGSHSSILGDACSRFGRIARAQLLEEVEQEMGYVEEKLKTLRRICKMLRPCEEIGDGG